MVVLYKFKSSTAQTAISFDGPHIGIKELKRRIIETSGLGEANYDLELSNAQTGEVFADEPGLIVRNTSVLVRRVPLHRTAPIQSKRESVTKVETPTTPQAAERAAAPVPALTLAPAASVPAEAEAPAARAPARGAGRYAAALVCPLSGTTFVDAVVTTCCGTSYSKVPFERALAARGACPQCGRSAPVKTLPNRALRDAVKKAVAEAEAAVGASELGGAAKEDPTAGSSASAAPPAEQAAAAPVAACMAPNLAPARADPARSDEASAAPLCGACVAGAAESIAGGAVEGGSGASEVRRDGADCTTENAAVAAEEDGTTDVAVDASPAEQDSARVAVGEASEAQAILGESDDNLSDLGEPAAGSVGVAVEERKESDAVVAAGAAPAGWT